MSMSCCWGVKEVWGEGGVGGGTLKIVRIRPLIYRPAFFVPVNGQARLAAGPGRFLYQLQRRPNVCFSRVDITNRDSEGIAPADSGVREVDLTPLENVLQQPSVVVVELTSAHPGRTVTKYYGREVYVCHSLELGIIVDPLTELTSDPNVLAY